MKKFEWVDHPADTGFKAYGNDLEEAFENAALALSNIIADVEKVEAEEEMNISLTSEDLEALLYDWIDHFIYLFDAKSFIASKFKVEKISKTNKDYQLEAKAWGEKYDSEKHGQGTEVKAMTYHMMDIKDGPDQSYVRAVVDI